MGVKASAAPNTAREAACHIPKVIRRNSQPTPKQSLRIRFTGKEVRCFIGFSSPVPCRQAQQQRGNKKFQKYTSKKLYAVFAWNYMSGIHSNQVFPGMSDFTGRANFDSPNGQVRT
jgi:hypothetical protein